MGLFGMGDGKMDLQLENLSVAVGQTLHGTATLTLNKDVNGKSVVAILYAEKTETLFINGQEQRRNVNVYSSAVNLDTEKVYTKAASPYQYTFSFVIPPPSAIGMGSGAAGALGSVMGALGSMGNMAGNMGGIIRWYVKVELNHEAMLTFAIAKAQEISIASTGAGPQSNSTVQG